MYLMAMLDYCISAVLVSPAGDRLVFDKGSVSPVSLDGVEEFSHL